MWWHTVMHGRGEVKGKVANGMGSQYPSHYLRTWCIQHYYYWRAHLGCKWTDAPCRFKWTHPFRWKTKSGFCTCAITVQLASNFCAEPLRIQTARPPRLRQVSHVRGVWKSVILQKITGSDTVKPQKTVNNRLIFGTLPYRPVWQAERQLTHHHQIVL